MLSELEINSADFSAQYKDSSGKNNHDYSQCLVTHSGFIEITKLWSEQ